MGLPLLVPPDDGWYGFPTWVVSRNDEFRMVVVTRQRWSDEWTWSVVMAAAEFARSEALELIVETRMGEALRRVPGVRVVAREDREVWQISGRPSGLLLAMTASRVARALAPAIERGLHS